MLKSQDSIACNLSPRLLHSGAGQGWIDLHSLHEATLESDIARDALCEAIKELSGKGIDFTRPAMMKHRDTFMGMDGERGEQQDRRERSGSCSLAVTEGSALPA